MTNHMTPTEQDKELREKLDRLIIENQSEDGSIDISDQRAMRDEILELIIADRKRVALEARIETVMSIDAMLRFENIPLHPVQAESLKQYLRQLEAQQEEV